jgi:hypothetical protein
LKLVERSVYFIRRESYHNSLYLGCKCFSVSSIQKFRPSFACIDLFKRGGVFLITSMTLTV